MHDLDFSDFDTCVDCIKGKLTIRVRKNRATISEKVLQLIHTDIYGPITRVVVGGFRYFITFINDLLRHGWIELLREKYESLDALKAFKVVIKLKLGIKITCMRSNKEGELYGRYDENGRNTDTNAMFFQDYGIEA